MLWKLVPALKVTLLHCLALPLWLQSQLVQSAQRPQSTGFHALSSIRQLHKHMIGSAKAIANVFLQRCRCALSTHGPADPESVSWAAGGTLENCVPLFLQAQGETVFWEVQCSVAQTHFSGTSKWLCVDHTTHYLLQAVVNIKGTLGSSL